MFLGSSSMPALEPHRLLPGPTQAVTMIPYSRAALVLAIIHVLKLSITYTSPLLLHNMNLRPL
jgi:hypothetical protein